MDTPDFKHAGFLDGILSAIEEIKNKDAKHHGVKGMKWGVRKDPGHEGEKAKTKTIEKLDKKFEKRINDANSGRITPELHNAISTRINSRVQDLNDSEKYRTANITGQLKLDYDKDMMEAMHRSFEDGVRQIYGSNASGTKQAVYNRETDQVDLINKTVQHAETDIPDVTVLLTRDARGVIISTKLVPYGIEHDAMVAGFFLAHFGVRGMKWGVRKPDGAGPGPASEVGVKAVPGKKVKTSGGKQVAPSADAVKAAVGKQIAKRSSTDALSNAELQAVVTRMQLEANYKRLTDQTKSPGRKFIEKMMTDPKARNGVMENISDNQLAKQYAAGKQVGDAIKNTDLSKIGM